MNTLLRKSALVLSVCALSTGAAWASTVPETVTYDGSYDEVDVPAQDGLPAGDYDTLGGLEQVGLFQLVEGANTFDGSVYGGQDGADVFLIEIPEGFRLVSASLNWAGNLPSLDFDFFNLPAGYLQQNTFVGAFGAVGVLPKWTLEESSETPTIFELNDIQAGDTSMTFGVTPRSYRAPSFAAVGPGIYGSIFDAGTTCAETYRIDGQFLIPECAGALDYQLTFVVERTATPPVEVVPLPAGLPLMLAGLGLIGVARARRKAPRPL